MIGVWQHLEPEELWWCNDRGALTAKLGTCLADSKFVVPVVQALATKAGPGWGIPAITEKIGGK